MHHFTLRSTALLMSPPPVLNAAPQDALVMGQAVTGNSCIRSLVPRRRGGQHTVRGASEVDGNTLDLKDWIWPMTSLLAEAEHQANPRSTDGTYPFDAMVTPINTRLIDLCANLMANEGTCQHSDHTMGRCLLYGASGVPVGAQCETRVPLETVPRVNKVCNWSYVVRHVCLYPFCLQA